MELAAQTSGQARDFTPALPLLRAYDFTVATFTRESVWRSALLRQLDPRESDVIADLGCGTASFLALVGKAATPVRLIGIDPDDRILAKARAKLAMVGVQASLQRGHLRDTSTLLAGAGVNKIVSSLVFHHAHLAEKRAGLKAIFTALPPGGELHIADYGLQRTRLMRVLFAIVQRIDGYDSTQPNADGILPTLMREAGFIRVDETAVIATPSGSISLYRGIRPPECA